MSRKHPSTRRSGSRPDTGRRPQSRVKTKHVQHLTLQVPAGGDQVPATVRQVADGETPYRTDAPSQTTDAVPGAPHPKPRNLLPPRLRVQEARHSAAALEALSTAYAFRPPTGRGISSTRDGQARSRWARRSSYAGLTAQLNPPARVVPLP
jgi:hypothetical protein